MRQWKRTPEARVKIVEFLRVGASRTDAASGAGLSLDTLSRWLADDEDFAADVLAAEAHMALCAVKRLSAEVLNITGDWRAALAWLERRRPEEWSLKWKPRQSEIDARAAELLEEILAGFRSEDVDEKRAPRKLARRKRVPARRLRRRAARVSWARGGICSASL